MDEEDFKLLSEIVVDPKNKIHDVPYPTMFNYPDDLATYSFTPYLLYRGNGWYEIDHSAPDSVKEDYENYFHEQKRLLMKRVKDKSRGKKVKEKNIE